MSNAIRLAVPLALPLLLAAVMPSAALGAAEAPDAHVLYSENCLKCHGPEVYTREDRKVTSYEGLERQVQRCETALGLSWFDEDIDAVTAYLNKSFYRFMPEQGSGSGQAEGAQP